MALPVIVIRWSTDEPEAQTRVASERVRGLQKPRQRAGPRSPRTRASERVRGLQKPRQRQTSSVNSDSVPKRPPRIVRELPIPHDLRDDGPTCALAVGEPGTPGRGEL